MSVLVFFLLQTNNICIYLIGLLFRIKPRMPTFGTEYLFLRRQENVLVAPNTAVHPNRCETTFHLQVFVAIHGCYLYMHFVWNSRNFFDSAEGFLQCFVAAAGRALHVPEFRPQLSSLALRALASTRLACLHQALSALEKFKLEHPGGVSAHRLVFKNYEYFLKNTRRSTRNF
jgi:hypothetical protein